MKKHLLISLAVALLILPLLPASAPGEEAEQEQLPEGQTQFLKAKCNHCHTVVAAGIGEPREEPEEESDIVLPPDLSTVGSSHEGEWMTLYLQKKETKDGNKHKKRFKGKDEQLAELVDWLVSLKAPSDTLAVEPAAEEAPTEEASVEETPAEEASVEETPAEEAPVEEAPAEDAPAEETD